MIIPYLELWGRNDISFSQKRIISNLKLVKFVEKRVNFG